MRNFLAALLLFIAGYVSAAPVNVLITIDPGALLIVAGKEVSGGNMRVTAVEQGRQSVMVVLPSSNDMTMTYDGQVVRPQNGKLVYVNEGVQFTQNGQQFDFTFKSILTTGKLRVLPRMETEPNAVVVFFTIEGPMNGKDGDFRRTAFKLGPTWKKPEYNEYPAKDLEVTGPTTPLDERDMVLPAGTYVVKAIGYYRPKSGWLSGMATWEKSSRVEFPTILVEPRKLKEVTFSFDSADSSPSCTGCN